jgi:D-alanyl-D-alanine carboxypeptidase
VRFKTLFLLFFSLSFIFLPFVLIKAQTSPTRALAKGQEEDLSSSPIQATAKAKRASLSSLPSLLLCKSSVSQEEDLSSSPTRALAKGQEEDLSSSPIQALAKGQEEDLSSSPIQATAKAKRASLSSLPSLLLCKSSVSQEEDLSSSPIQATAKNKEEGLPSSPIQALVKNKEEDLSSSPESLARQIEIIKQDISVLQSLILNYKLNQKISSPAYLAAKISDNQVILDENSTKAYPIASITKLMSAVIALENIGLEEKIILSEEMLEPLGYSPCLFLGLNISAENLIKASLIQSVNDASESLSYFIGKELFINLMNEKAQEIGMTNTVFYDTHGLNPANTSTVNDLNKLLKYIFENHPEILEITKDNNFWLANSGESQLKFQNVNNFYLLPDFIGGKTGYLPEAKQTLASIFKINGEFIAIILLYSNNRQADAFNIIKQLKY